MNQLKARCLFTNTLRRNTIFLHGHHRDKPNKANKLVEVAVDDRTHDSANGVRSKGSMILTHLKKEQRLNNMLQKMPSARRLKKQIRETARAAEGWYSGLIASETKGKTTSSWC